DGRKGLERRYVAAASHDDVRLATLVVRGPRPDAQPFGAVFDGLLHRQPLRRRLLARDHNVYVVTATQAVVGDGKQAVAIGRQVNADDLGLFVDHVVDETGILM